MSKYRVLKVGPKPPFLLEYQLIAPNGRLLVEVNQYAVDSIINARDILNQETAPLHAEIERLKAENAKLRKFVQDVRDLEAVIAARTVIGEDASESFWDGLNQVNEAKAFMYDKWKEESQELLDELEEMEVDNA